MGLSSRTNGDDMLRAAGRAGAAGAHAGKKGAIKAGGAWRVGPAKVVDAVHADMLALRVEMQVG